MGVSSNRIKSLIEHVKGKDPRLYEALIAIVGNIANISDDPNNVTAPVVSPSLNTVVPDIVTFSYTLTSTNIRLDWLNPGTSTYVYEVRQGNAWDTATFLFSTLNLSAVIDPLPIGTTRLLIKAMSSGGIYSVNALALDVVIPAIGSLSLNGSVIENNVLIDWIAPTSTFNIALYEVFKDGILVGTVGGTFAVRTEPLNGTYLYGVRAKDIAGNYSALSTVSLTVSVAGGYLINGAITSTFSGTKTNCWKDLEQVCLVACLDDTQTFREHFVDNSWDTFRDQIDAGYEFWLEPGVATAEYQEVFDFEAIFTNSIISVNWSRIDIVGSVTIECTIEFSDDNVTWSTPVTAQQAFMTSGRYVRVTLDFTGDVDQLVEIFNLQVLLSVKMVQDSGVASCNAGDVGGTEISFNQTFKSVSSITATPQLSTTATFVVIDFDTSTVNPTTFLALVFDSDGNRVDSSIFWTARGVV